MLDREHVNPTDLEKRVAAKNTHFSEDATILEVRWMKLMNLILVDTPGVLLNETNNLSQVDLLKIFKIVVQQINEPNTRLIVVLDGLRDCGTDPIEQFLNNTKPNWSEGAIVLVNKCDGIKVLA